MFSAVRSRIRKLVYESRSRRHHAFANLLPEHAIDCADGPLIGEIDVRLVSDFFEESFYLLLYRDVAEALVDPLDHYRLNGWIENRNPASNFDTKFYKAMHSSAADYASPIDHYAALSKQQILPRSLHELVESKRLNSGDRMMSTRVFLKLLESRIPHMIAKPYAARYLMKYLSSREKLNTFSENVAALLDVFPENVILLMIADGLVVYSDNNVIIRLQVTKALHAEGDLTLSLENEGELIYESSFSIAKVAELIARNPGSEGRALLLARFQGVKGGLSSYKRVSTSLGGIQVQLALLSAAQGFADALGLSKVYGVLASHQLSFQSSQARVFAKSYDEFLADHGGEPVGRGLLDLSAEVSGSSAASSTAHRRRARQRREARSSLRRRVCESIAMSAAESTAPIA